MQPWPFTDEASEPSHRAAPPAKIVPPPAARPAPQRSIFDHTKPWVLACQQWRAPLLLPPAKPLQQQFLSTYHQTATVTAMNNVSNLYLLLANRAQVSRQQFRLQPCSPYDMSIQGINNISSYSICMALGRTSTKTVIFWIPFGSRAFKPLVSSRIDTPVPP